MKHFKKLRANKQIELINYVVGQLEEYQDISLVKYYHDVFYREREGSRGVDNYFRTLSDAEKWIADSGLEDSYDYYVEDLVMDFIIKAFNLSYRTIKNMIEDKEDYNPNVLIHILVLEMLEKFTADDSVDEAIEHIKNL